MTALSYYDWEEEEQVSRWIPEPSYADVVARRTIGRMTLFVCPVHRGRDCRPHGILEDNYRFEFLGRFGPDRLDDFMEIFLPWRREPYTRNEPATQRAIWDYWASDIAKERNWTSLSHFLAEGWTWIPAYLR